MLNVDASVINKVDFEHLRDMFADGDGPDVPHELLVEVVQHCSQQKSEGKVLGQIDCGVLLLRNTEKGKQVAFEHIREPEFRMHTDKDGIDSALGFGGTVFDIEEHICRFIFEALRRVAA